MSLIDGTTDEGLRVEESLAEDGCTIVREVGHFGYVIYEYRRRPFRPEMPHSTEESFEVYGIEEPGVGFLGERLADLERRCADGAKDAAPSIDLARWKWNLKATKRRLRRLVREKREQLLEIPAGLHDLVKRVLDEGPEPLLEFDSDALNKRLWEDGAIDEFYQYERRKAERVILVVPQLPPELRALLSEANEAYFHGLFRATVALCRAVLEDLLRRVVQGAGPMCQRRTGSD